MTPHNRSKWALCVTFLTVAINLELCHSSSEDAQSKSISEEEPGILLPPEDKYNFVGQIDPTTPESEWRTGRSSPDRLPGTTTIVSKNSYSIRPDSSSYTIQAKPIPIVTTIGNIFTVKEGTPEKYSPYKGDKSTIFVKNNCFGPRCPPEKAEGSPHSSTSPADDDWKSYHYILNKDVKHQNYNKQRRLPIYRTDAPLQRNFDEDKSLSNKQMTLSIPFIVDPTLSKYETDYPSSPNNQIGKRVLRTTTPSSGKTSYATRTPGWVKLKPFLSDLYDPFTLKSSNNNKTHHEAVPNSYTTSQFSDRLGVELDPDSFADRWGWGEHGLGGSRIPSWVQDNNYKGPSHDRDAGNDRNWVKLEPIPVSGVTISKWVPKGTPSNELPSTNWPTRDRISSNGIGHSNPQNHQQGGSKWWDVIDNINRLQQSRPSSYDHSSSGYDAPPRGWSSNKNSAPPSSSSSWDRDRTPQNPWGDVIYPDGPGSATVSWQKDKDMSKYASSFPISSTSSPWQSDRRPATGSWSADPFEGDNYNRRQGSGPASFYPDKPVKDDDPRWVLVSNSRKVSVNSHGYPQPDGNRYNKPSFDKFSDFPYYEQPPYNNRRRGKDYKDLVRVTNITVTRSEQIQDQDAAFNRVNATLASLTPVLKNNKGNRYRGDSGTDDNESTRGVTSSTVSKMPSFLRPYFGNGRDITYDVASTPTTTAGNKVRKGLSINPVYAAVGAGMIPAAMAAVLPVALGRRRRSIETKEVKRSKATLIDGGEHEQNFIGPIRLSNTIQSPRSISKQINIYKLRSGLTSKYLSVKNWN